MRRFRDLSVSLSLRCTVAACLWLRASAPAELVAHWPLDDVRGGRSPDAGAGGHHVVLHGRDGVLPQAADGVIGGALRMDARHQQVLLPDPPLRLPHMRRFTVMAWVRPVQSKIHQEILCQKSDHGTASGGRGWRLRYSWRSARLTLSVGDRVYKIVGMHDEVRPGHWSHVAGVFDGRWMRLYVNGLLLGSREVDGEWRNSDLPLVIGNYTGTKKPYAFDGLLDEVRVYDTALTEDEIVRAAAEGLRR